MTEHRRDYRMPYDKKMIKEYRKKNPQEVKEIEKSVLLLHDNLKKIKTKGLRRFILRRMVDNIILPPVLERSEYDMEKNDVMPLSCAFPWLIARKIV